MDKPWKYMTFEEDKKRASKTREIGRENRILMAIMFRPQQYTNTIESLSTIRFVPNIIIDPQL